MLTAITCPDNLLPSTRNAKVIIYSNKPECLAFFKEAFGPSNWQWLVNQLQDNVAACPNWPQYENGMYEVVSVDEKCPEGCEACCADEEAVCVHEWYDADGKLINRFVVRDWESGLRMRDEEEENGVCVEDTKPIDEIDVDARVVEMPGILTRIGKMIVIWVLIWLFGSMDGLEDLG